MKNLFLMSALAALVACSPKSEEAAPPAAAAAPAETAAPAAPVVDPSAVGTYDVKYPDGTMAKTVINADGTFVDTDSKGVEEKGMFTRNGDKDCFDPEGDKPAECWTSSAPGADGSFTSTSPDGKTTVTVSRARP